MSEGSAGSIANRLDRLEQENRRWKGAVAILAVACVGLLALTVKDRPALAAATPTEIQARRFVVVDGVGQPRIVIGDIPLTFWDGKAALSASGLAVLDDKGKPRARIYYVPTSRSVAGVTDVVGLELLDRSDHPRIRAELEVGGRAVLRLTEGASATSTITAEVGSYPGSGPTAELTVQAPEMKSRVGAVKGEAWMVTEDAKHAASLRVTSDGPRVALSERGKSPWDTDRVVLGPVSLERSSTEVIERRPLSSLVLFDRDGKVIWKAP